MNLKQTEQKYQRHKGINEFKNGYQPRTNIVRNENNDLLADFHSFQNRWKKYFHHLLNIHGINDVKQTEMHIAQ
jgi:hypothetical protein